MFSCFSFLASLSISSQTLYSFRMYSNYSERRNFVRGYINIAVRNVRMLITIMITRYRKEAAARRIGNHYRLPIKRAEELRTFLCYRYNPMYCYEKFCHVYSFI